MNDIIDKKNILIIFNSLIGVIGGGSRHIVEVSNRWVNSNKVHYLISKEGYNVAINHIGTPHKNKKILLYSTFLDKTRLFHLAYISRTIKSIFLCRRLKKHYNIVIAPNYLPQNIIPAIFMKSDKTKLIVYFHTTAPEQRNQYLKSVNPIKRLFSLINWQFCLMLSKKYFDTIFVINNSTKEYFIRQNISPNKIYVITNAIPYAKIYSIEHHTNKEYTCVFLGRLVKSKGIIDLVKIWSILTIDYPSAKLCILGDGPDREVLENEIRKNSLEQNIVVYGQVENDEKYELMKMSDIFLYPSYYESQGIVILEALACELIVVAYELSTYQEFYHNYLNTVKIGDFQGMAMLIHKIIKNPVDYKRNKENIRNFVSKFDWDLVAKQQEEIIKK